MMQEDFYRVIWAVLFVEIEWRGGVFLQ